MIIILMPKNVEFTTNDTMEKQFLREISNDKDTPKQNKVSEHNDLYFIDEDGEKLDANSDPVTLNEF